MDYSLPISAVLPIYNCKERLERHLRSVVVWAPLVKEIIVVDSGSTDGTLELALDVLTSFGALFIHNPPGLYQSWNAGIAAATSPWCYISTVEDPISPKGLTHLLEIGDRYQADIVISPPDMMDEDGTLPTDVKMPGNYLSTAFKSLGSDARLLTRLETIMTLLGLFPHGLLGSSASNLYRTSLLQENPFPIDLGHCGDTAFGAIVAPFANVAFTPVQCAKFLNQTKFRDEMPSSQLHRHHKLEALARSAIAHSLSSGKITPSEAAFIIGWFESYSASMSTLWNWLNESHLMHLHLQKKYEGGIFNYLKCMIQDEFQKLTILRK